MAPVDPRSPSSAATGERDAEQQEAADGEHDPRQLAPVEPAVGKARGDVGKDADAAGGDALDERE